MRSLVWVECASLLRQSGVSGTGVHRCHLQPTDLRYAQQVGGILDLVDLQQVILDVLFEGAQIVVDKGYEAPALGWASLAEARLLVFGAAVTAVVVQTCWQVPIGKQEHRSLDHVR